MTKNKGFTLIELLVVIAIIGILAALVLVALGNARDKANDARIKSDIGQLRTLAEVFYDDNSSAYDGGTGKPNWETCFGTPTSTNCISQTTSDSVTTLKADMASAYGSSAAASESDPDQFCIIATLRNGNKLCVDASGAFKENTATTCVTATPVCS